MNKSASVDLLFIKKPTNHPFGAMLTTVAKMKNNTQSRILITFYCTVSSDPSGSSGRGYVWNVLQKHICLTLPCLINCLRFLCVFIIMPYLALLLGDGMLGSRTLYWSMIFSTSFCFSRRSSLSFSLRDIRTEQLRGRWRKRQREHLFYSFRALIIHTSRSFWSLCNAAGSVRTSSW